jgi:hypothetical protein
VDIRLSQSDYWLRLGDGTAHREVGAQVVTILWRARAETVQTLFTNL